MNMKETEEGLILFEYERDGGAKRRVGGRVGERERPTKKGREREGRGVGGEREREYARGDDVYDEK